MSAKRVLRLGSAVPLCREDLPVPGLSRLQVRPQRHDVAANPPAENSAGKPVGTRPGITEWIPPVDLDAYVRHVPARPVGDAAIERTCCDRTLATEVLQLLKR